MRITLSNAQQFVNEFQYRLVH